MVDLRQSPQYANFLKLLGWQAERVDDCQIYIKRFPLIGALIKIQRPEKIPSLEKIEYLAKKCYAFKISLEPKQQCNNETTEQWKTAGYRASRSPYLPTKTLQLDLRQPLAKILKNCRKDCRYCLKKAFVSSLQLIEVAKPESFWKIWRKSLPFHKWLLVPPPKNLISLKKNFGENCHLLLGFFKETPLGGTIILMSDKIAYYYYAFTNQTGRKLLAQYFLVWESIKLAKREGYHFFDFEGIYDERSPIKSWQGFSHFKKSFGGEEISYPLPLVKTQFPLPD
jgi:hypothetical protein